nr:hypothetical protein [Lysobacter enzymogenes]
MSANALGLRWELFDALDERIARPCRHRSACEASSDRAMSPAFADRVLRDSHSRIDAHRQARCRRRASIHGRNATIDDATGVGSNPNKRRDCGSLAALLASRARPPRVRRLPPAAIRAAQHGTHAGFGVRPI